MRLLIPVNKQDVSGDICQSFGRAPYFMIWHTDSETSEFHQNDGASSHSGAGIRAAQKVLDLKADVVITPRLGKNAADVIVADGIKVYGATSTSILDNIQQLREGKMELLTAFHPGFHRHGRG